jgi:DNA-binding transcriptional LysR family regulator
MNELRIADVATYLVVLRSGSLSGAARELKVTTSQVSKALSRLSDVLRQPLVVQSGRGIAITDEGRRLRPQLQELMDRLQRLQRGELAVAPQLTVAAPSYVLSYFLPHIVRALPDLRIRGLELPPALIRADANAGYFDVALSTHIDTMPEAWVTGEVGQLRKAVLASPPMLGRLRPLPLEVDALRELPFVGGIMVINGQVAPTEDDCPLPRQERLIGHEAPTIRVALTLAASSDQLVFGPVIAATEYLRDGLLNEVPVRGWKLSDPLLLACHGDRVRSTTQRLLERVVRAAHDRLGGASA